MLDRERVPLFPLPAVLFPGTTMPLHIFELRYRQMVEECLASNTPFGIVLILEGSDVDDGSGPPVFCSVGCLARIARSEQLPDGRFYIEATGCARFRIDETGPADPYLTARVTLMDETPSDADRIDGLAHIVRRQFRDYIASLFKARGRRLSTIHMPEDPVALSFSVAGAMEIASSEKQSLLEMRCTAERLKRLAELLGASAIVTPVQTASLMPPEPSAEAPSEPAKGAEPTIKRISAKTLRSQVSRN